MAAGIAAYIFALLPNGTGRFVWLNMSFSFASASFHLSWLSFDSFIQASAIARAGVISCGISAARPVHDVRVAAFLFGGGDGDSMAIYSKGFWVNRR
jgi:hypothetical protein